MYLAAIAAYEKTCIITCDITCNIIYDVLCYSIPPLPLA